MLDDFVWWGFHGGRRYWDTLVLYIAEIEHRYNGLSSVPIKFHLRLCGKKDYKFYNHYDFRYGLVNEFLQGLKVASESVDVEIFILPEFESEIMVWFISSATY
jgi:hypothetical protein